ncbi:MAG: fatty acid kinase fatty acid binding subunit [Actinomycetota bacterium]|nr:fatty acid kinase fatty acid binding subunit [Actinomycetota bacterium]
MPNVAVVTDSTSYLPESLVDHWGIRVVPVLVIVGGRGFEEGTQIQPWQVAEALREWKVITTSRPTPADFASVYAAAAEAGATEVVSIHLSADMSGTYESAVMAAAEAPLPVTVIDSRSVGMGLGFAVLAAARSAVDGADAAAVAEAARTVIAGAQVLFYVDTLEYLRRGGRIGAASAAVGTALRVKPLLQLTDGRVAPLEKARTANKALARLADLTIERIAGRQMDVAVQHLAALDRAQTLADELGRRLGLSDIEVNEVGAVVGAHVGPGMVSVSIAPRL